MAIYGVIMAIILQGKVNNYNGTYTDEIMFAGYALFWTGISVGFSNLFCGFVLFYLVFVSESQAVDVLLQMHKTLTLLLKF